MNDDEILSNILLVAILSLMLFGVWAVFRDFQKWEAFVDQHNCEVVKEAPGATTWLFVGGVMVPITNPPTATYLCENGKKYTR
jgi:hypothetical protein